MISITDKELAEKLLQTFAGYDAPARSLAQEAARRLIEGQKSCANCRNYGDPFDDFCEDTPCFTCVSSMVIEGVRTPPTNWAPVEDDSE